MGNKQSEYKNITIKISGKHIHGAIEEDQLELITEAKMYEENGILYILYDESELSGMEGVSTRMRLSTDSMKLVRSAKGGKEKMSEMFFKEGSRFQDVYETPMGTVEIELLTNQFHNTMNFEGTGNLKIEYDISLKGLSEGRSRLEVEFI